MGFLKNDGDIILDVVLTDAGRARIAKGDGSFNITKFALGDDEINYEQFNKNHPSGSAYYDLEILQSPVFQAPSDNRISIKNKLITIANNDLLYLPVLRLNELFEPASERRTSGNSAGSFVVTANEETEKKFLPQNGIMLGENPGSGGIYIRVDQGLDTEDIAPSRNLDDSLLETQYSVEIDHRLGSIVSKDGSTQAQPSFIDDDDIASYLFSFGVDTEFVSENTVRDNSEGQVINGPRGTFMEFKILSSLELNASNALFNKFGSTVSMTDKDGNSVTFNYIDTNIKVQGVNTGASVDVPVRFIRV